MMLSDVLVILAALGGIAGLVVLVEPSAAELLAKGLEKSRAVLLAHAEARRAARTSYRRVWRFCRLKAL